MKSGHARYSSGEQKIEPRELAIGLLLEQGPISSKEISVIIRRHPAAVTRIVRQKLIAGGFLEKTGYKVVSSKVSSECLAEARMLIEGNGFEETVKAWARSRQGRIAPRIHIVPSAIPDKNDSPVEATRKAREFGMRAAPIVEGLLAQACNVGIAWGGLLATIVSGIERRRSPREQNLWERDAESRLRRVWPMCGDPLDLEQSSWSSSVLAARLQRALDGHDHVNVPNISRIPAILSISLKRRQLDVVREFFGSLRVYQDLFGRRLGGTRKTNSEPVEDKLDAFLTSVSDPENPLGYGQRTMLGDRRLGRRLLKSILIGDMGGFLLPRPGLNRQHSVIVEELRARWTGISESAIRNLARRGLQQAHVPGTIVVAYEASKAAVIAAAMNEDIVGALVISTSVADALASNLASNAIHGAATTRLEYPRLTEAFKQV